MQKCIPYVKIYDAEGNLLNPIGPQGYRHPVKEERAKNGEFIRLVPVYRGQQIKKMIRKMGKDFTWMEQIKLKLHFSWLERKFPHLFKKLK